MNLFALASLLWRHKRATIPVIVLTLLGMFYAVAVKPPTCEAKASVLLTSPPAPPTAEQIAADPSLAHVHSNNPYVSLGNLVYVADVLIEVVSSESEQQALLAEGANPSYQVALDVSLESPPAIDVTGVAPSPQDAMHSAQLVANAVSHNLYQLQAQQGVDPRYMISSIEYVKPTSASSSSSSKLRTLIEVFVLGLFVLLVAVSVSQGLRERKNSKQRQHRKPAPQAGEYNEPLNGPVATTYDQYQRATRRMGESQQGSLGPMPEVQSATSNNFWNQIG